VKPAAGWLRRRLVASASDAGAALRGGRADSLPPRRLRARVGAPGAEDYVAGGRVAAEVLADALAPHALGEFASVLDFGCGPGRVLPHLARLHPSPERLVGVDVDPQAIAWASTHLGGMAFELSDARPPLPFGDREFALVYSISVFSHLDEADQDAWLSELARVLRPGGVALLSTHGPSAYEAFRSGAVRTAWCDPGVFSAHGPLAPGEILAVPYRRNRWSAGDLPGVGEGYGLTFHGSDYLREHWSTRGLEVDRILPRAISGWQDLIVMTRKPTPTSAASGHMGQNVTY
jgi:SAM-dependent methyltransferase